MEPLARSPRLLGVIWTAGGCPTSHYSKTSSHSLIRFRRNFQETKLHSYQYIQMKQFKFYITYSDILFIKERGKVCRRIFFHLLVNNNHLIAMHWTQGAKTKYHQRAVRDSMEVPPFITHYGGHNFMSGLISTRATLSVNRWWNFTKEKLFQLVCLFSKT